jgi:hypothetical protein
MASKGHSLKNPKNVEIEDFVLKIEDFGQNKSSRAGKLATSLFL